MVLILYNRSSKRLGAEEFEEYMALLPMQFQEKIRRFHKWEDAQRSLFGNLLLKRALEMTGIKSDLDQTKFTEYQRPWLSAEFDYNISHSGEFTICALSKTDRLGIDVEEINEIFPEEFEEQFSQDEISIMQNDETFNYFFKLWTQKEAFLKAIGKGLSVPLNQVSIIDNKIEWENKAWYLHEINLAPGYAAHLCTEDLDPDMIIKEIIF